MMNRLWWPLLFFLGLAPFMFFKRRVFSRELQERAQSEGLRETMQVGRELEKIAQKGLDAKASDERFKSDLAGMTKKLDAMQKSAAQSAPFSAADSQQSLRDLKSELDAARDLLNFPEAQETQELGQKWLDQLGTLPQLKRQFDKQGQAGQRLDQSELKSFLSRLEKQVTGELDRRTLLDAQQFLEQLMNQGQKGE